MIDLSAPKKPQRPFWLRDFDRMKQRLKARAAAEWARLRTERRAPAGPGGGSRG